MRFPPLLAFDCGASRVTAALFSATSEGVPVLEKVFVEELEYDTADDQQWVRAVGDAIRRIGASQRLRGRISLIIPGHLTLTKYIKVPHVDEAKRQRIIQFEARQNIPYPLDEVVWDFQIVYDDGIDFEVALCAVKRDVIEALLAECRSIGFEPDAIEPSGMAQVNALGFCYRDARQGTLVINIGARSSNLVFVREDRYFIRNITLSGGTFTQMMAEDIGHGLDSTERTKLELARRGAESESNPEASRAFENARQQFASRMALEITRSIANYRRQSGVDAPTRVLLTGAGSLIPGIGALLAEKLKVSVETYEPLRNVPFGSGAVEGEFKANAHRMGETIGTALRANQRGVAKFNLLPDHVLCARAFRRREPFFISSAALVVAALAIPILVNSVTVGAYRERLAALENFARPLRERSLEIRRARDAGERVGKQVEGIKGLVETKANWITLFRDLQERLVKIEDVWLDKLEVLRPAGPQAQTSALAGSLFGGLVQRPANAAAPELRLNLAGRLLDKNNPFSKVSPESQQRVNTLLNSFRESQFIDRLEHEKFDNSQEGVLKFDFILVVDPQHPL